MRYEVKIITKDGSERWLYLTSGLIQFAGRPLGLASAFDITERKEAEEQLRHQAFHEHFCVSGDSRGDRGAGHVCIEHYTHR